MAIINAHLGYKASYRSHQSTMLDEHSLVDSFVPQTLFFAVIATIPFWKYRQLGDAFFMKLDWLLTAVLLVFIAAAFLLERFRNIRLASNLWGPLGVFYVLNVLVSLSSPYPSVAFGGMIVLTQIVIFVAINLIMLNDRGVEAILPWVLGLSVATNALLGVLGLTFGIDEFVEWPSGRGLGGTVGANNMALMSVFCFPIMANQLINAPDGLRRLFAALVCLLLIAGLISSESRGGFLSFLLTVGLFSWHWRRRFDPRYLGLVVAGAAAMVLVAGLLTPKDFWERQASLQLLLDAVGGQDAALIEDSALDRRSEYLVVAGDAVSRSPLWGWGTDTFKEIWFLSERSDAFDNARRPAHNTYIEVLVGSGLLGLGVFFWLLLTAYRNFLRSEQMLTRAGDFSAVDLAAAYRFAMLSVLIYFLVKSGLEHKLFLLILPLSTAMLRYAKKKRKYQEGSQDHSLSAAAVTV